MCKLTALLNLNSEFSVVSGSGGIDPGPLLRVLGIGVVLRCERGRVTRGSGSQSILRTRQFGDRLCTTPGLSLEAQPIAKSLMLWGNSRDVGVEKCQGRACVHAKSLPSCLTLCDTMVCSLPGSSVHGILQARILEWVAMPSSRGPSRPRDQTCFSYAGKCVLYH